MFYFGIFFFIWKIGGYKGYLGEILLVKFCGYGKVVRFLGFFLELVLF